MKHLEDLQLREPINCGSFAFSEEETVGFAARYDPHPFHLEHEPSKHSIFGRLTGSGAHAASAARQHVLQNALGPIHFLGSPGELRMRMHSPLYPGREVHVTHAFESVELIAGRPGVGLVSGVTRGVDGHGELVITMDELSWVGSRDLRTDAEALDALDSLDSLESRLGTIDARLTNTGLRLPADAKLFFEDCELGAVYASELTVDALDFQAYRDAFDATRPDGSPLHNEWYESSLAVRILADALLLQAATAGGPGLERARWPLPVQPGDRILGEIRIIEARPLLSRPHLGLIRGACTCANQRGEVVATHDVITFVHRRGSRQG